MTLKAAIYGRVSTDRQSELSIEAQVEACQRFCEDQGWDVYDVYTDFGISGTSADKRPALQRMLQDGVEERFSVVVAHKVDRAFRNMRDYENVKYELEQSGIFMAFVESGLNVGAQGEFMNGLMALMAQQYSMNLSREIRKTMRKNVEAGNFLGGVPPFGFQIVDKRYTIHPDHGPVALELFKRYASGDWSMRDLADDLNLRGFKTTRGGPFTIQTMHGILKNEKYNGIYIHNIHQYNQYGKRKGKRKVSPDEVIRIDGAIPKLVDDVTWEKVRERVEANKRKKPGQAKKTRARRVYLLSGLIECEACGSPMHGQPSRNTRGYETVYYACSGRKKKNGCTMAPIEKSWIEAHVVEAVLGLIDQLDAQTITDRCNEIVKGMVLNQTQEIDRQRVILADLEKRERNLMENLEKGGFNRGIRRRLDDIQEGIKDTKGRLDAITPRIVPNYSVAAVSRGLAWVKEQLEQGDLERQKEALQAVVWAVSVGDSEITVTIKAELGQSGLSRPSKVGGTLVAEVRPGQLPPTWTVTFKRTA